MKQNNIKVYLLTTLLALTVLLGQSMSVQADAIWEPYEDDFYREYYMECELHNRDYLTNSKEGYVTFMESPKSSKELAKIENGKEYEVSFIWTSEDGDKWGIIELESGLIGDPVYSWVPMNDLSLIYDEDCFYNDYKEEFTEYQGEFDGYEIKEALILWEYPGAERYAEDMTAYINEEAPEYSDIYIDPDGNAWAHFIYYYGYRDRWVCIDAPEERELKVSYDLRKNVPEIYGVERPEEELNDKVTLEEKINDTLTSDGELKDGASDIPGLGLAVSLVAVVVAVTAALIAVLFRKNGKNTAEK